MQPNYFIYNASAGSGKTYTLVKNYLKILLQSPYDDAVKRIIAVTFTNKAAEEMKQRIIKTLRAISFDFDEKNTQKFISELSNELKINDTKIVERAQKNLQFLLHNYSYFNVTTIDKFNLRILKSFAKELGLSHSFSVEIDSDTYFNETITQLINEIGAEDALLSQVMLDYVFAKIEEDESWNFSDNLTQISKNFLKENNRNHFKKVASHSIDFYEKLKLVLKKRIKNNSREITEIIQKSLRKIADYQLDYEDFFNGKINGFKMVFEKLLTNDSTNTESTINNYLAGKLAGSNAKHKEAILAEITPELYNNLLIINDLITKNKQDKLVLNNLFYLQMQQKVHQIINELKTENDTIFIEDFNTIISEHLQAQPSAFIYEKLGSRIQHFFIDEFQDTSQLQWNNFLPLIEDAKSTTTSSVTLVGDPKQSIYRFRGGKPEIMLNEIQQSQNDLQKKLLSLDNNYRSLLNIIDFNNEFYKQISQIIANPEFREIFEKYSYQNPISTENGRVQISYFKKEKDVEKQLFAQHIYQIIQESLQNGFSLNDIVILVRKNKIINEIAPILMEKNIPFITEEALQISNSNAIQSLIHFLYWTEKKSDKKQFVYFLYYYFVATTKNVDFTTIASEIISQNPEKFLIILNEKLQINLTKVETQSFNCTTLFETIFRELQFDTSHQMYLAALLDLINEEEKNGAISVKDFLIFWEEKGYKKGISFTENADSVRIMTIHKSKGLEFPVVIFPTDYSEFNKDDFWVELEDTEYEGLSHFYTQNISEELAKKSTAFYEEKSKKTQERQTDFLCLNYVATTRATEQLFILDISDKIEKTIFAQFAQEKLQTNEPIIELYNANFYKQLMDNKYDNERFALDWISESWNTRIGVSTESVRNNTKLAEIKIGNFVHQWLSKINTENDINFVLQKAILNGELVENQREKFHKLFGEIIHHKTLHSFFSEEYIALNERDFLLDNEIFRPDKIFRSKENKYIIIDYKTGKRETKHQQQILKYKENLTQLGCDVQEVFLVYISETIEVLELK